jgi:hypothetical protein
MADKGKGGGEETASPWLGITIEIIVVIAILAVVVWNFAAPFTPTYLNLDYLFGKMLIVFRWLVNFFTTNDVGGTVKVIGGLIVVFLVALNFYLFIRLLEMEDEHEDHVYHHAEDHERPRGLFREVLHDAKEFAGDTAGFVAGVGSGIYKGPPEPSENFLNRVLYRDEADFMDPIHETGQASFHEEVDEKEGSSKWRMVLKHMASHNPSDWKLAIIEADTILDALVERSGFPGTTLGERLKNADRGVFSTLDFAWEAHKVRNRIAHEGLNFVLTERDAKKTIREYEEVFREFKYI